MKELTLLTRNNLVYTCHLVFLG